MIINVWLENGMDGHSLVWALEHPGCFSNGQDASEALASFPAAFVNYQKWISAHTELSWCRDIVDFDVRLQETWNAFTIDSDYELAEEGYHVHAWFRHDWKPLTRLETQRAQQVMEWSRKDLLALVSDLPPQTLDKTYPNEKWSIRGILGHIASAEWWLLDRLDLTHIPRKDLPEDAFQKLLVMRDNVIAKLAEIEGLEKVMGKAGEFWSPRKLLRRIIWHELDHIAHIHKLLNK